jgi:uncharacterized membrane protein YfcA
MRYPKLSALAVFIVVIAINYFVMGLMNVCEISLQPSKVLVPIAFALTTSVYAWFRAGENRWPLVTACGVGTFAGAVIGRYYPWGCF